MGRRTVRSFISDTQRRTLLLLAAGKTTRAVAQELGVCERTVRGRMERLRARFGVNCRVALVVEALKQGSISLDEIEVEHAAE